MYEQALLASWPEGAMGDALDFWKLREMSPPRSRASDISRWWIEYLGYRLAWLYVYGKLPDGDIDHINGKPSDDRIKNLRDVSRSVNLQNQRAARSNNSSGLLGIFFQKTMNKWTSKIQLDWKTKSLGYFDTAESSAGFFKSRNVSFAKAGCLRRSSS